MTSQAIDCIYSKCELALSRRKDNPEGGGFLPGKLLSSLDPFSVKFP